MRKTILLAIIACILGIVLLSSLAFYIPNRLRSSRPAGRPEAFTGFEIMSERDTDRAGSEGNTGRELPNDTLPEENKTGKDAGSAAQDAAEGLSIPSKSSDPSASVAAHRIIWAGDSRTLGLRDALRKADRPDEDLFVGKVGEGVRWFREEGMSELSDVISQNPDLPVVMNFGVNDPQLIDDYIITYKDVIRAHPGTDFYILSVNPLDEEFLLEDGLVDETVFNEINSLNVAKLNVRLKEEFKDRYIDSASWLKSEGFDTVDGLHFSTQTYLRIHDFVVDTLF